MGNLPCCNAEERTKESALQIPGDPNGSQTDPLISAEGHRNNSHGALSSNAKKSSSPQPPTSGNGGGGAGGVPIDPSDPNSLLQLEERQRALHQEQERLERIVNNAGRDMVNVNGGGAGGLASMSSAGMLNKKGGAGSGGAAGSNMMMHMNGYYDAGYASEMWHCLIPSRTSNGPGGLIPKCEGIMEEAKIDYGSSGAVLRKVPNSCIVEVRDNLHHQEVVDVLSRGLPDNQCTWNEEVVRALEQSILDADGKDPSASGAVVTMGNDGMEMVLDDLAERFLASVFREGGSVRAGGVGVAPIVENVL